MLYDLLLKPPGADAAATALVCGELRLSRADLDRAATALARKLVDRGVVAETPLALIMPNSPEQVVAILAAMRLEARLVLLDPALKPAEAQAHCARASIQAALVPVGTGSNPIGSHAAQVISVPAVRELLEAGVVQEPRWPEAGGRDRTSLVFLSSGSTGMPKLVLFSADRVVAALGPYRQLCPCEPNDRMGAVLPLFHAWGARHVLVTTLASGASVHFLPAAPRQLAEVIARERVTILPATPFIFRLLIETEFRSPPDFSSLRQAVSGGAPLAPHIAARFHEKFGLRLQQVYGSTESSLVMSAEPADPTANDGWVWRSCPGITLSVLDPQGREVPDGTAGMLTISSPSRADGYLEGPGANTITALGERIASGDLALRSAAGHFVLLGRERPMLNVAGKKASPAEIEACLRQHPAMIEAVVTGAKTPDGDDRIRALVTVSAEVTAQALRDFCAARLAAFKVPREIEFTDAAAVGPLSKPRLGAADNGEQ